MFANVFVSDPKIKSNTIDGLVPSAWAERVGDELATQCANTLQAIADQVRPSVVGAAAPAAKKTA
jgi:hypothetical protein